ncbi:MAG: hypothetical protein KBT20_02990 [Bacteroidales bacterium]|nr:hypothetical protein [Candidatus Liminaster caballi]
MTKRFFLVLLLVMTLVPSVFAQKFTKKEQARREAREANYFCGASFTFTGGYTYSWMSECSIDRFTSAYGRSELWGNNCHSFNLGFLWDQAFSRQWGLQTGAFFNQKGGDHLYFYDNGLGYGPVCRPEETNEVTANLIELQCQGRYFFPLTKRSRISVNAGGYIDKVVGSPSGIANWNMGIQCGLGYDWQHVSVSATYQPGMFKKFADDSKTKVSGFMINAGFRFWKK